MSAALRICSSLLRSRRSVRRGPLICRSLHERASLRFPVSKGFGEFLPPDALKVVAVDYQEGLLQRLNHETVGTKYATMSVVETVQDAASNPTDVLAFNLASLALNNHFFLDHLKPPPEPTTDEAGNVLPAPKNHQHEMSEMLRNNIEGQYGSVAQFKSTFSSAALGMFSSGYIWFVTDQAGRLAIVPTFGAGSLLIRARQYTSTGPPPDLSLISDDLRSNDPYHAELEREMKASKAQMDEYFANTPEPNLEELEKWDAQRKQGSKKDVKGAQTTLERLSVEEHRDILLEAANQQLSPEAIQDFEAALDAASPSEWDEVSKHFLVDSDEPDEVASIDDLWDDNDQPPLNKIPPKNGRRQYHTSAARRAISDPAVFDASGKPYDLYGDREPPSKQDDNIDLSSLEDMRNVTIGDILYPLLCVSVHEHAWMSAGYGVWGKEEWMTKFWDVVDWERVSERFQALAEAPNTGN